MGKGYTVYSKRLKADGAGRKAQGSRLMVQSIRFSQQLTAEAASLIEKEILSCGVYKKANIESFRIPHSAFRIL